MNKFLLLLVFSILGYVLWHYHSTHHPDLTGYVADSAELDRECQHLYGHPLDSAAIEKGLTETLDRIHRAEYHDAIAIVRGALKETALPMLYNNLGTLYEAVHDVPRALSAYHQALDRDPAYPMAAANLTRLRKSLTLEPVPFEIEPNNTSDLANDISFGIAVQGEIAAGMGDRDVFSFTAPPPPRDLLQVEVQVRSQYLAPRLRMLDENGTFLNWDQHEPAGKPLQGVIAPKPNAGVMLELSAYDNSSGGYSISVRPLKAFDRYEPNDTVFQSTPIAIGQTLEANIMDSADTDFYSFLAPQTGTLTVTVTNRSSTLSPGLTLLATDKSTIGFGPDVPPGESVRMNMSVQGGRLYYVQVWSEQGTAGDYSVTIK